MTKKLKKSNERLEFLIEHAVRLRDKEVAQLPEYLHFYDFDYAWAYYNLLEVFSDSLGGWRFLDVLGVSALDLSEQLLEDLTTLRWVMQIINDIIDQEEDPKDA